MGRAENEVMISVSKVAFEIVAERRRQMQKWGDCEKLPDGTRNGGANVHMLAQARQSCDRAYREGRLTHAHVLEEEVYEALTEEDPVRLRAELIQVAAVVAKWIQDIDSRPK